MLVIFTVILLGLLVLGLPVAFSLGTAGLFGMFAFMGGGSSLAQIPILAYKSLDDFVLTAVPLYILMSQILLTGKVGNDLFELGNKWLRHLPGGVRCSYSFCLCNFLLRLQARLLPAPLLLVLLPFLRCCPVVMKER